MVRTNISISEVQHRWLKDQAEERGLSMSEIIRRALDTYDAMSEADIEPGSKRARYLQFVGEHMGEFVGEVVPKMLEELGRQGAVEVLRQSRANSIRELEEQGKLGDWLLQEGEFQDES